MASARPSRTVFGSVTARATLGATAVVALALLVAGVAVLSLLQSNLLREVELRAEVRARDVAGQIATDVGFDELSSDGPVQVVDAEGRVRAVSEDLESLTGTSTGAVVPVPAPSPTPTPFPSAGSPTASPPGGDRDEDDDDDGDDDGGDGGDDDDDGGGEGDDRSGTGAADPGAEEDIGPGEVGDRIDFLDGTAVVDGEERDYRFAVATARTPRGEALTVYAGAELAVEQAAVGTVRTALLIGSPLLLLVVAATTWRVTRRALRPVEGIRQEMAEITRSTDLSRRVPEPAAADEVGRLARTTNETLGALEASVERQRRFVADASHELRSPIASLRTQLEVGEAHPELLDVPGAVQDTVRLQVLAADLLLLARLDAGEGTADRRVELSALVGEEVARRGTDRVPVTTAPLAAAETTGSSGQLARVLANLLDNAQRHAESRVRVSVRGPAEGRVVLEVADDGAGVPEEEWERIFERFVRLDDARSRDDGGAGLGLAIAREVARRHGGELRVGRAPEGGALFVLRLPAAGRDGGSPEPDGAAGGPGPG